jgi:hypothetical protein
MVLAVTRYRDRINGEIFPQPSHRFRCHQFAIVTCAMSGACGPPHPMQQAWHADHVGGLHGPEKLALLDLTWVGYMLQIF